MRFLLFLILIHISPLTQASEQTCLELFSQHGDTTPAIESIDTFAEAMTRGMLLLPGQEDLFQIYRTGFFGDPITSVNSYTLKSIHDLLEKHPELSKRHFREFLITQVRYVYESPTSLTQFILGQSRSAGAVRSNFFQIDSNLGYWKKLLTFQEIGSENGGEKENYRQINQRRFLRLLNLVISVENRKMLADPKQDYRAKINILFKTLLKVRARMMELGRDTRAISQALVDLVHTAGYNNAATVELLKSKNGLDKIEGFKKIIDERDALAMDLGYEGHFTELINSLGIDHPTGSSKNENYAQLLADFTTETKNLPKTAIKGQSERVRSLSIQEAPFRSCLGGSDCSTRTYFSRALDPNFNYFTITKANRSSSGHVTVVLGSSQDPNTNETYNIAFIDKLQNVSNQDLPIFLEAVRQSLAEKDYILAMPRDVGDHNGLSNMDTTRQHVTSEMLPLWKTKMGVFTPHTNQYTFEKKYSRADNRLEIMMVEPLAITDDIEIEPGSIYEPWQAPETLTPQALITEILRLKDSPLDTDKIKFIDSLGIIDLSRYGFNRSALEESLDKFIRDPQLSFAIRKKAFFRYLENPNPPTPPYIIRNLYKDHIFDSEQWAEIFGEMQQWARSSNWIRKRIITDISEAYTKDFSEVPPIFYKLVNWNAVFARATNLQELRLAVENGVNFNQSSTGSALHRAVEREDIAGIEYLMDLPGFPVNFLAETNLPPLKDLGKTTALHIALVHKNQRMFQLMIKNPMFDTSLPNNVFSVKMSLDLKESFRNNEPFSNEEIEELFAREALYYKQRGITFAELAQFKINLMARKNLNFNTRRRLFLDWFKNLENSSGLTEKVTSDFFTEKEWENLLSDISSESTNRGFSKHLRNLLKPEKTIHWYFPWNYKSPIDPFLLPKELWSIIDPTKALMSAKNVSEAQYAIQHGAKLELLENGFIALLHFFDKNDLDSFKFIAERTDIDINQKLKIDIRYGTGQQFHVANQSILEYIAVWALKTTKTPPLDFIRYLVESPKLKIDTSTALSLRRGIIKYGDPELLKYILFHPKIQYTEEHLIQALINSFFVKFSESTISILLSHPALKNLPWVRTSANFESAIGAPAELNSSFSYRIKGLPTVKALHFYLDRINFDFSDDAILEDILKTIELHEMNSLTPIPANTPVAYGPPVPPQDFTEFRRIILDYTKNHPSSNKGSPGVHL
jgi:hypothetical protein